MVIIVKQNTKEERIRELIQWIESQNLRTHISTGDFSTVIGVIGDTQYSQEAVVRMGPGQGRPLGDVIFVYEETRKVDTNAFFADEGKVLVLNKNEDVIDELHPQRQTYKSNGMEMTAAGISHGFFRDFYVSMGNRLSSDEFLVRLSIRPLVSWIWIGGLIMLLSAVFSSAWRRREWSQS